MTDIIAETRLILANTLQLGEQIELFVSSTELLGSVPELDSMAVVSLITAIEEHFSIIIEDEEITAEVFDTFGSLTTFISDKLQANDFKSITRPEVGDLKI